MFPTFEFLGREIGLYGIFAVIGLLFSGFVAYRLCKKFDISFDDMILVMLTALFGGFIIGHFIFALTNISEIIIVFQHIGELWFKEFFVLLGTYIGGMVYYGGFIGGALGIVVYTHFAKLLSRKHLLDIYAVVMPLFHAFGRIGCFFGGCCYGVESKFGFTVTDNVLNPSINGVNRFPVQLLESVLNLLIFLFLLYLIKKEKFSGDLLFVYMIIYPVIRFFDEFLRGDTYRGFLFGLSTSQWISIILFVIGVTVLVVKKIHKFKAQEST